MNSIVTVTTAADETKLTTLERVKLEIDITDGSLDDLLNAKIDDATSDIAVRVRPSLKRETVTETFWHDQARVLYYDSRGGNPLILSRFPAASITSVTLDDVLIDAAEYRLDAGTGLLYRLDASGYPSCWSFGKAAVIVYAAGYLLPGQDGRNLPPSLEAACIELVGSYWASRGRDPMLKSEENVGVARFDYWMAATALRAGNSPSGGAAISYWPDRAALYRKPAIWMVRGAQRARQAQGPPR